MREHMIANIDGLLVAPNPLAQLMRLNQLASASASIDDEGKVTLEAPSPKVDDMVDLLEELGDEPLVVAAVSRQLIELAAERLERLNIPHGLVTGAQSGYERGQAIERFQNGRHRVILLTLGAGAEGLTLTRASRMLFMQESYSSIQNQQAEDRIYRIGSERHDSIQIIKQITPGTVEEIKQDILATKAMRMEEVVRDRTTLLRLLGEKP
jgi:SNF2 family DNA or RNA helicase